MSGCGCGRTSAKKLKRIADKRKLKQLDKTSEERKKEKLKILKAKLKNRRK